MMCLFRISHQKVMTFVAHAGAVFSNPRLGILCGRPPLFNNVSQAFWNDPQSPDYISAPLSCRGRALLYRVLLREPIFYKYIMLNSDPDCTP